MPTTGACSMRSASAANERIAGFVHIGRPAKPPEDRERPPLETIVTDYSRAEEIDVLRA